MRVLRSYLDLKTHHGDDFFLKGPCKMQGSAPEETASLDGDAFTEWIDPGLSAQFKRWVHDPEHKARKANKEY